MDKMQTACPCGLELPMHLVDILDGPNDRHVCACEREYKSDGQTWTCVGTAVNPVARFDRARAEKSRGV